MKITTAIKSLAVSFVLAIPMFAADPQHVVEGNSLIDAILANPASTNVYNGDGTQTDQLTWTGSQRTAISVCGTFVSMLMKHTYNWTDSQYRAKTGSTSPNAAKYYEAVTTRPDTFTRINSPISMASGDVIAVKYPAGAQSSGHVMIATAISGRNLRNVSTQSFLNNGAEANVDGFFDITVMDSSQNVHGPDDTRASKPGGVGRNGVVRMYVDINDNILGYTWTTSNGSEYRSAGTGYLVAVGRIIP